MFQRLYRQKAIVGVLAHKLLRPVTNHTESLFELYPQHYTTLPEVLISDICAHVRDICN